MNIHRRPPYGFTLIELLIGLSIAAFLMTAITQLVIAAGSSYQLQQNLGALQENARFALHTMQREIEAAGYVKEPWINDTNKTIDSNDAVSIKSDKLLIRRWTNRNCYDNLNPVLDAEGISAFHLRESSFVINTGKNLAQTCRYGPDSGQLTTQINNLGLVEHTEALQALYAEDTDADGNADRWVPAGHWLDESNIIAVQLAIVVASPSPVTQTSGGPIQVLDTVINSSSDGRLRKKFQSMFSIKGRRK